MREKSDAAIGHRDGVIIFRPACQSMMRDVGGALNALGSSLQHIKNEILKIHRVYNEVPYSKNNILTNYPFERTPAYLI